MVYPGYLPAFLQASRLCRFYDRRLVVETASHGMMNAVSLFLFLTQSS